MSLQSFQYVGSELAVFAKALVWKKYLLCQIRPFLKGHVAEVGAGLGATTEVFANAPFAEWLALEPDAVLASDIPRSTKRQVFVGTLADLPIEMLFDAILYIDVLEHIEDDSKELALASKHLRPGGHLIVLGPAHNFLFSQFDRAIGHFRRYNKQMLKTIAPSALVLRRLRYLDCSGFFASVANRILLKQSTPNEAQILFWDRFLVRISKVLDPICAYLLGKSVLGIWEKRP